MPTSLNRVVQFVKRFLFFDHIALEWTLRILLTLNVVLPGFPFCDEHYYPLDVLVLTVIAYWLALGRLKLLALLPHLFAFYITYLHLTADPH